MCVWVCVSGVAWHIDEPQQIGSTVATEATVKQEQLKLEFHFYSKI